MDLVIERVKKLKNKRIGEETGRFDRKGKMIIGGDKLIGGSFSAQDGWTVVNDTATIVWWNDLSNCWYLGQYSLSGFLTGPKSEMPIIVESNL